MCGFVVAVDDDDPNPPPPFPILLFDIRHPPLFGVDESNDSESRLIISSVVATVVAVAIVEPPKRYNHRMGVN